MSSTPRSPFHDWAARPPLGWNSWDCFATTVTEEQTRAQAEVMSARLSKFGWRYIVVDIQWYEPASTGYAYREGAEVALDEWGRLLPALNRFPSATGGRGFKPLADYVHTLGLDFGVHLMRGIPRRAVEVNLPIKGTSQRARDIANQSDRCPWNPDMFGVDMTRPGAQAYYDSVFELFASWGVDYVKLDDMSRPYHDHEPEIEAVRRAIDKTGRPIVLSLSPGETALSAAEHVKRHANLWRISDDFWDNWHSLVEQFARVERWSTHRGPGHWPDADMLPLGVLRNGQYASRLTQDEQRTVMTLWAIVRSPLMFGGDLTRLDDFTFGLLSNEELLRVNQRSMGNRLVFNRAGLIAWVAEPEEPPSSNRERYLAVFNTRDRLPLDVADAGAQVRVVRGSERPATLEVSLLGAEKLVMVADDGADNSRHPVAAWGDPRVLLSDGSSVELSALSPCQATAWWGDTPRVLRPGDPQLVVAGKAMSQGFTAPTKSLLEFELPHGTRSVAVEVGFAPGSEGPADEQLRFALFALAPGAGSPEASVPVVVRLEDLGLPGAARVRDLWSHADLGIREEVFQPEIAWHGCGLYHLTAV